MGIRNWFRPKGNPLRQAPPPNALDELLASLGGGRYERLTSQGASDPIGIRITPGTLGTLYQAGVAPVVGIAKRAAHWIKRRGLH